MGALIFFILTISLTNAFNIDWKYPIIIKNPSGLANPNQFGANVKLKTSQGSSWIILGAPKANSSLASQKGIFETGQVLRCSLGRSPETCDVIVMDTEGNEEGERFHYRKDGGLLGSQETIALSPTNFISCAPRWEKRDVAKTLAHTQGVCYTRPVSSILGGNMGPPPNNNRLKPLDDPRIEGDKMNRNGMAGFSVHTPKTGSEVVMGAPGMDQWSGSVIQYLSRDGGNTFANPFVSDPKSYQDSISKFNYFGYTITSGYFFEGGYSSVQRSFVQYASGAPRGSSLAGKVVIFRFPEQGKTLLNILDEIRGEQTGSYFGAALLAIDLNGDGLDELIVGAPRYSRDLISTRGLPEFGRLIGESKQGRYERYAGLGDEGAAYIYSTNGQTLTRQPNILRGGNRPSAQFGTAMISLGDLNRDGLNDFAISAPFQDGSGAIYIYHGSRKSITKHSQLILASQIDSGLRGFGFSLALGEDLDNNGFTDIAVGSFNSSSVVVLRSKPVITVSGQVKSTQTKLPLTIKEFPVDSCVSYLGDYAPDSLELEVKLRGDSNFRPSRVHLRFKDKPGRPSALVEYKVNVAKGREICTQFTAMVIEPLETYGAAVSFQQTINLGGEERQVKARVMNIRNGRVDIEGEGFSQFCKTCPILYSGKPNQFELNLPLAVHCGEDDVCVSDLRVEVSFQNVDEYKGFLIGSEGEVVMDVSVRNLKETAIAPAILVTWMRLKLKRVPGDCSPFSEEHNLITYKCSLGQLLEEGNEAKVSLEYDMSDLVYSEQFQEEILFNVTAITASEIENPRESSKSILLPIYAQADWHLEGSRYLESFNEKTRVPYVVFKHSFDVGLDGPSPIQNMIVVFDIPVNLTTEEGTLINVRGVTDDGLLKCQPTKGHFSKSDLALIPSEEDSDYHFGGVGGFIPKERDLGRESNSSFVEKGRLLIHCHSPYVSCMEVTCKSGVYRADTMSLVYFVMDMEADVVRSLMKKHKVNGIQIESRGRIVVGEGMRDIQPGANKQDTSDAITIIEKEGFKPISKWIYILAVVIGLLVLACIVFCFYSCGCFETKKEVKAEDAIDGAEMSPLNEEEGRNSTNSVDTEPPEFVPENPPIPEEDEDEGEEERKQDWRNNSFNRS